MQYRQSGVYSTHQLKPNRLSNAFQSNLQVQAHAIPSEVSICHDHLQGTGPDLAHGWTLFARSAFLPCIVNCMWPWPKPGSGLGMPCEWLSSVARSEAEKECMCRCTTCYDDACEESWSKDLEPLHTVRESFWQDVFSYTRLLS